jgi:2,4-dienoyl-CoA reductase-like NADH-dependent reductase (Old Yellow Enzyme family)
VGRVASRGCRFAIEIVRRTRAAVGADFIVVFRLSMLDLVEGGTLVEIALSSRGQLEAAGATCSTPGSAGTRRACRRSRAWCRERRSPGSPVAQGRHVGCR